MTRNLRRTGSLLAATLTLVLGGIGHDASADGDEIPFDEASLFFELNNTDGDLGIHALIDGEPRVTTDIQVEVRIIQAACDEPLVVPASSYRLHEVEVCVFLFRNVL